MNRVFSFLRPDSSTFGVLVILEGLPLLGFAKPCPPIASSLPERDFKTQTDQFRAPTPDRLLSETFTLSGPCSPALIPPEGPVPIRDGFCAQSPLKLSRLAHPGPASPLLP